MRSLLLVAILMISSCQKLPEKSKVLRVNISREPTCFDPRKVFDPSHQMLMSLLFEGLFKLELDLTVTCAQAQSYEISSDQLTYTFHLGAHVWSDKSPVTAHDYVQTFLDILSPQFPSPHSHLLYDILNAEEAKKGTAALSEAGIRALDPKTVEIRLKRPNPCFLQILASPYLVPICRRQEDKNPGWAMNPNLISNGMFTLAAWVPKAEISLKRNRNYSGRFPAKINGIHISLIANEMSALHLYGNGFLDLLGAPLSQIPLPYLKDLKERESLVVNPVSASLFIGFNTQLAPFDNVHFRRALSLAIHRRDIIEHITLLDEEPGLCPIPSVLKLSPSSGSIPDGNEAEAKKELEIALQQIPKKSLKNLTLYFWSMEVNYLIAQTLQQQWRNVLDLEVKIEVIDFKSLLSKVKEGSYQMSIFAWSADYADPIALLHRFRYSHDALNYSRWENQRFSALLDSSAFETDPIKRAAILEAAEALLTEEMPIAPLFHWNFSLLIQPEVKGFAMDPLGHIHFDQLSF